MARSSPRRLDWVGSRRNQDGSDPLEEDVSRDQRQRVCSEAQTRRRIVAEQLARPDVAPQHAPRTVTGGLGNGAFGRSVQCRLSRHARSDAMPRDISGIHSSSRRGSLQNRRDRIVMQPAGTASEFSVARDGTEQGAFADL